MKPNALKKSLSFLLTLAMTAAVGAAALPDSSRSIRASAIAGYTDIVDTAAQNFTANGLQSQYFEISGNLSTSKGTATYQGMTLTQCLKMESTTSIRFTTGGNAVLTLVVSGGETLVIDGAKTPITGEVMTINLSAGDHTILKGSGSSNLFYMSVTSTGAVVTTAQTEPTVNPVVTTAASTPQETGQTVQGDFKLLSAGGWNEMLYAVVSGVSDAQITGVSYSGAASGTLSGEDLKYLVRDVSGGVRVDIPGIPAGTYDLTLQTAKGNAVISGIKVTAQDRSGYAHFNYTAGVGAYNDDGSLKKNAIVLYVTDENKNTVTVKSKDGTTVTGIGNILNSNGASGSGKTNTNQGIIKKLSADGTPLVIRILGDVKAPDGLTAYDSTDFGGSVGDNGFMARMRSGKDVTIEGIGTDAAIDGWGIHFIAESSAPDFGKSFEVRNLKFKNVPEDCIGMEGVQDGNNLTAAVERCWIHNNEFYKPTIANPAESDKAGGDGACDFKRGMYFTNSYNYYEGYHKTNLVGASDSNLQFHLTYHHNYWKDCESRGPLSRQANIHMYNNVFEGQTSYCQNTRANAYIFSEYNLFNNCKSPQRVDSGAIKSFNDTLNNCSKLMQATVVNSKDAKVTSGNRYESFELDASVSYIPANQYTLLTDTSKLLSYFTEWGGTLEDQGKSGSFSASAGSAPAATEPTVTTSTTTVTTTAAPVTTLPVSETTSAVYSAVTTTEPVPETSAPETTATVSSAPAETSAQPEAGVKGDANCSGGLNVADAVLAARVAAEDKTAAITEQGLRNADVDGVPGLSAEDVVWILRVLAGLDTL